MVWINILLLSTFSLSVLADPPTPPKLLTKHAIDSIRYISMDGRFAYVKKRPGVLGLISYYRSADFLSENQASEFVVHASKAKIRVIIEVIRNSHTEFNFFKPNKIMAAKFGDPVAKEIGQGLAAKLHLQDEWVTYYKAYERAIIIQNLVTQKKYEIRVANKPNPFFIPDVMMINPETVVYSDINEQGLSAVISYNLLTQASSVIYKSSQSGTGLELCQASDYLAIGEFPYEGVTRGSQILQVKTNSSFNLASYTTIYSSLDQDLGNMVCLDDSIYFSKTMNQDKKLGIKVSEAVKLTLKDSKVTVRTSLKHVNQLIEMDGRVLAPIRGDHYVLEGEANLGSDTLKSTPNANEELPLEI